MKLLNLDQLVKGSGKSITLDGVQHEIIELDLDTFVAAANAAEGLRNEDDVKANLLGAAEHVCRMIPSLSRERVMKLKFVQLFALTSFINAVVDEEAENAPEQAQEGTETGEAKAE